MRAFHLTILFTALFPCVCLATSVQEQWQSFYQRNWQAGSLVVTAEQFNLFSQKLLRASARYPDFEHYSWKDIQFLYEVSKTCKAIGPIQTHLSTATEFELALCNNQPLDDTWFVKHESRHPAGGSFLERYLSMKSKNVLDDNLRRYLTLYDSRHPLYKSLSTLSVEGREALLNGYRAWMEDDTLWLIAEQGWKAIPSKTWRPIAHELNITFTGPSCELRYSNLCISQQNNTLLLQRFLTVYISLMLLFLFGKGVYSKRQQNREKRFILQLLTHELRTPITSLGLTVEMLRDQFEQLTEETQQVVWRLVSDHQRLTQLTENSKVYLSTHSSHQLLEQSAYIMDWLDHMCEKHGVAYQLNQNRELSLPFYWLSICLDNLVRNAKQHGKGDILVAVTLTDKLKIEVSDQGDFPSVISRFINGAMTKPNSDNMGIGLSIVRHLITMMGGKLKIYRHPTRCILVLPL
ncbi:DUF3404 domain-containing protein [Vibrio sp.]|uniref:ATP-binding protein n=1 Tax=Vibrio sp. TaxID=678 RepID=UPI00311D6CE9